jgi:hypothetical protein
MDDVKKTGGLPRRSSVEKLGSPGVGSLTVDSNPTGSPDEFEHRSLAPTSTSSPPRGSLDVPKIYPVRKTLNLFAGRPTRFTGVRVTSLPIGITATLARTLGLPDAPCDFFRQKTIDKIKNLSTLQIVDLLNETDYEHIHVEFEYQSKKIKLGAWEALTVSAGLHDAPELFGRLVALGKVGSIERLSHKAKNIIFCEAASLISALFRCSALCQSADPAFDRKVLVENARDLFSFYLLQNSSSNSESTFQQFGEQFQFLSAQANVALSERQSDNSHQNRILYSETAQNFGAFLGLLQQGAWTFANSIEIKDKHRRDIASRLVTSISVAFRVPTSIAFPPAIAFVPAVMDFAGRSLIDLIFNVRSFKEVGSVIEGSLRLQVQGGLLQNNPDGSVPTAMDLLERNFNASMFFNGCDGVRRICGN